MRLAYADPPYPGKAHLYPEKTEVDHAALIAQLCQYDGWALSTDSLSLRYVLGLCPPSVGIAAWVKTNAPPFNADGIGAVRSWEPVIYSPARATDNRPDRVRDVLHARINNGRQFPGLTGTKPEGFAEWIFGLLEADVDDTFDDVFPGTGRIGAAWRAWSAQPSLIGAALGGRRAGEHKRPGWQEIAWG